MCGAHYVLFSAPIQPFQAVQTGNPLVIAHHSKRSQLGADAWAAIRTAAFVVNTPSIIMCLNLVSFPWGKAQTRLRYARYIGLARTHLQETASAAAINLARLFDWLMGERPKEPRISPFLALAAQT
jgi:hypothetical protein